MDIKPIYSEFLSIISKKPVYLNDCDCYYDKGNLYLDPYGNYFPCGPASKSGDKYRMTKNDSAKEKSVFSKKSKRDTSCMLCPYYQECQECPINVETNSKFFCEYALEKLRNIFEKIRGKKFQVNKYVKIIDADSRYLLVDFLHSTSISLSKKNIYASDNYINISNFIDISNSSAKAIFQLLKGDYLWALNI